MFKAYVTYCLSIYCQHLNTINIERTRRKECCLLLLTIFAKNLKFYRNQKDLSQEKLAELAGLHRTYISAVERERRNISLENIERIANALEIEPYLLLKQ